MLSLDKFDILKRAEELIRQNTLVALRYACLELRYCIESICYEKIKLYEKHVPKSVYETWQPKKVIETLQEYDPTVMEDYEIAFFTEKPDGTRGEFILGGKHTNLPFSAVTKHYYKLGRFLHVPTLAQQREFSTSKEELKAYLETILPDISAAASNTMTCNLGMVSCFKCKDCGNEIIRNIESLKNNPIAICTNETCRAEYDVSLSEDGTIWKRRELDFECPRCHKKNYFGAHLLKDGKIINCFSCRTKYVFTRRWYLQEMPVNRT
jgi:hypothetical protein